jgi:diaminopimelate epimerase
VAVLSMGNPHAVQVVDDVDTAPVAAQGPLIEHHPRFPQRVNAGFMQVVDRGTSGCACSSAAPAKRWPAARAPARRWWRAYGWGCWMHAVDVQTHGGILTIEWQGEGQPVLMTGPATTVFEGDIEVPDLT